MYLIFKVAKFDNRDCTEEEKKRDLVELVKYIITTYTEEKIFKHVTVLDNLLDGD